jgi:dipeptidyl-peptidase-4
MAPSGLRAFALAGGLALTLLPALEPWAAGSEDFLTRYSLTRGFRSGQPTAFAIPRLGAGPGKGRTAPGDVLFLRSGPRDRVQSLWSFDPNTGAERELLTSAKLLGGTEETLSPEEKARRERLRLTARGLSSFQISNDGRFVLVPLSGRVFLMERATGVARELAKGGDAPADDARLSPDGTRLALVRRGEMRVLDIGSTGASGTDGGARAERVIAAPESAGVSYGLPEFVAQEEMDRFEGYWWSPDSRWLLVQRTDASALEKLRIMDPSNPTKAPEENPYPRPGMQNADVRLALHPVGGGPAIPVEWDRKAWPYLCRVTWTEKGALTIYLMDRRQQHASLLTVDPATGRTDPLLGEHDTAWLNLPDGAPRWLPDGRSFLWLSEHDDTGPALELQQPDHTSRRLTPPGLHVRKLIASDAPGERAWVLASDEPGETHLWSVDLKKPWKAKRVAAEPGVEDAVFSPDGAQCVRTLAPERGETRWLVEDARGKPLGQLKSVAESPGVEPGVEWTTVGKDSLRAFVIRPHAYRAGERYPVIDWAYAGPHSQRVVRTGRRYLLEQWLADQGFIVVTVDGHGTPGRGRAFERAIRGDFIGPALADHEVALRELCARHPEMDRARVGAFGWSFGGFYAAQAVIRAPDTYRAGVAGAPVVDWHDYDTFYTERYLGVPPADSAAYERSSVLTHAASLSRPLLMIHGTADDNVYFVNSLKLADALNRANRSWEFLPLPGQTHIVSAPEQVRQVYGRALEFFHRELGGISDTAPARP